VIKPELNSTFSYTQSNEEYRNRNPGTTHSSDWIQNNTTISDASNTTISDASDASSIVSVTINQGVTEIPAYAFYWCDNLESIDFSNVSNTLTTIGDYAFVHCTKLTEIIIPDSVTSIGNGVFIECYELQKVTLSKNIQRLAHPMFIRCYELTEVILPNRLNFVGPNVFESCSNLTNLTLVNIDGTMTISRKAFVNCDRMEAIVVATKGDIQPYITNPNEYENRYYLDCKSAWGMIYYPIRMIVINYNPHQPIVTDSTNPASRSIAELKATNCFEHFFKINYYGDGAGNVFTPQYMRHTSNGDDDQGIIGNFYNKSNLFAVSSFTKDDNNNILTRHPTGTSIQYAYFVNGANNDENPDYEYYSGLETPALQYDFEQNGAILDLRYINLGRASFDHLDLENADMVSAIKYGLNPNILDDPDQSDQISSIYDNFRNESNIRMTVHGYTDVSNLTKAGPFKYRDTDNATGIVTDVSRRKNFVKYGIYVPDGRYSQFAKGGLYGSDEADKQIAWIFNKDFDYQDANFSEMNTVFPASQNMSGVDFTNANFSNLNINYTNLESAILTGINVQNANFSTTTNLNNVISGNIIGVPHLFRDEYSIANGYIVGQGIDLSTINTVRDSETDVSKGSFDYADLTNQKIVHDLSDYSFNAAKLGGTVWSGSITGPLSGTPAVLPDGNNANPPDQPSANYKWISNQNGVAYVFGPGVNLSGADLSEFDLRELTNNFMSNVISGPLVGVDNLTTPNDIYVKNINGEYFLIGQSTKPWNAYNTINGIPLKRANDTIVDNDIVMGDTVDHTISTIASNVLYVNCLKPLNQNLPNLNLPHKLLNCLNNADNIKTPTFIGSGTFDNIQENSIVIGNGVDSLVSLSSGLDNVVFIGCRFTNDSKQHLVNKKVALIGCEFNAA
jgi:uncharacterized protein YjbI with pentapeptide repeats